MTAAASPGFGQPAIRSFLSGLLWVAATASQHQPAEHISSRSGGPAVEAPRRSGVSSGRLLEGAPGNAQEYEERPFRQLVSLTSSESLSRLRIIGGGDECPGREAIHPLSGTPLFDSTAAPLEDAASDGVLWSSAQGAARPGRYRACICEPPEDADPTLQHCADDADFNIDVGTFTVEGPVGVSDNDGQALSPAVSDAFNLTVYGDLTVYDKVAIVERSYGACGVDLGQAPSGAATIGYQMLAGGLDLPTRIQYLHSAELFEVSFSLMSTKTSPVDGVLFWLQSPPNEAVEVSVPPTGSTVLEVSLLSDLSVQAKAGSASCKGCAATCAAAAALSSTGTWTSFRIQLTNSSLAVLTGDAKLCATVPLGDGERLPGYSHLELRRGPAGLEIQDVQYTGQLQDTALPMLLPGLEGELVVDLTNSSSVVTASEVVLGGSSTNRTAAWMWPDLLLTGATASAYRVCLCPYQALLVNRLPKNTCQKYSDFVLEAGTFAVGGWSMYIENALAKSMPLVVPSGRPFAVVVASPHIQPIDDLGFMMVDAALFECGSADVIATDAILAARGQPFEAKVDRGDYREDGGLSTIRWNQLTSYTLGLYRLCFCPRATIELCRPEEYAVEAGIVEVVSLSVTIEANGIGGPAQQGDLLDLSVIGSAVTSDDRVYLVADKEDCEFKGAVDSAPEILARLADTCCNASALAKGEGRIWYGVDNIAAGSFRICWCGGLGDDCGQSWSLVDIGEFFIPTTTTTSTTTVTLTPCEVPQETLAESFACSVLMAHGEQCDVLCKVGFDAACPSDFKGDFCSPYILCQDGVLEYVGSCVPGSCKTIPRPAHSWGPAASCMTPPLPHNATCDVQCQLGYHAVGEYWCNHSVVSSPSCKPDACDDTPNTTITQVGSVNCQDDGAWPHGSACGIDCPEWYRPEGGVFFCNLGFWNTTDAGEPFCQPRDSCGAPPSVTLGLQLENLVEGVERNYYGHGGQVHASCAQPRRTKINSTRDDALTCHDGLWRRSRTGIAVGRDGSGSWSVACEEQHCQAAGMPPHTEETNIECTPSDAVDGIFWHGSTCRISCAPGLEDAGYELRVPSQYGRCGQHCSEASYRCAYAAPELLEILANASREAGDESERANASLRRLESAEEACKGCFFRDSGDCFIVAEMPELTGDLCKAAGGTWSAAAAIEELSSSVWGTLVFRPDKAPPDAKAMMVPFAAEGVHIDREAMACRIIRCAAPVEAVGGYMVATEGPVHIVFENRSRVPLASKTYYDTAVKEGARLLQGGSWAPKEVEDEGPKYPEGLHELVCSGLEYQSTCVPSCKDGFVFDTKGGQTEMRCGASGIFVGNPGCTLNEDSEIYRCGEKPKLESVMILSEQCSRHNHGTVCEISCPNGYNHLHSKRLSCAWGEWSWSEGTAAHCQAKPCLETPTLLFGLDHSRCAGQEHGSTCPSNCTEGREVNGDIVCSFGEWMSPGICLQVGLEVVTPPGMESVPTAVEATVVQCVMMIVVPSSEDVDTAEEGQEAPPKMDYNWALSNEAVLAHAIAVAIGVLPALVQVEVIPASAMPAARQRRRLQEDTDSSFGLKVAVVVSEDTDLGTYATGSQLASGYESGSIDNSTGVPVALPAMLAVPDPAIVQQRLNMLAGVQQGGLETNASDSAQDSQQSGSFATEGLDLLTAVRIELRERGLPEPSGLDNMAVQQALPPVLMEDFMLPPRAYGVKPWGRCYDPHVDMPACGLGVQDRYVLCLRGEAAGACLGERLGHARGCYSYDGCPWYNMWCPLGAPDDPRSWTNCHRQAGITAGILYAIAIVCCLVSGRWLQLRLRRPMAGSQELETEQGDIAKANWCVIPKSQTQDKKEHIVWDTDALYVAAFLNGNHDENAKGEQSGASTDLVPLSPKSEDDSPAPPDVRLDLVTVKPSDPLAVAVVPEDSDLEEDTGGWQMEMEGGHTEDFLREARPLFEEGTRVDYFSVQSLTWLPAEVFLGAAKDKEGGLQVVYNVKLLTGKQVRHNVPMDALRLPFDQSDPLQVFSRRDGGTWHPATAHGQQHASASIVGYGVKVHIDGHGTVLDRVPPSRLRRHFLEGAAVDVYRGHSAGWLSAVVHAAVRNGTSTTSPARLSAEHSPGVLEALRCKAPGCRYVRDTRASHGYCCTACGSRGSSERPPGECVNDDADATHDDSCSKTAYDDPLFDSWIMVPIYQELPGEEGLPISDMIEPEWVPSYLVRSRTVQDTSVDDAGRRQLFL
eukprot:TRINITY_DN14456_c0_g1_i1.p1 TRINITY_DN14456_c0_g1~~TRINITY_DN14456_c0_g1_i1.p1  ORF type:complete len:2229 (+),score=454.98 TRINITY_DN14456_c0_g1_i1:189-6875(+)